MVKMTNHKKKCLQTKICKGVPFHLIQCFVKINILKSVKTFPLKKLVGNEICELSTMPQYILLIKPFKTTGVWFTAQTQNSVTSTE